MKLLVPFDAPFTLDELPDGVQVCGYDAREMIPDHLLDADAVVVWGFGAPNLRQLADSMPNLRWVQTMAAGPDAVLAAGLPDRVQVTVGRGFHDKTVTETAVALTLSLTTNLPRYGALQQARDWQGPGFRPLHVSDRLATIIDAQVLIWGFGSIGQHMAPVFTALGAHVRGVASTAGERSGYPCYTVDDLDWLLPETDVLMMVLPHSSSTAGALDARRIALLKPTSLVVNVGRGTTIDEAALVSALEEGRIGGAGLDVFATEPLPESSPLWGAPNTLVTPHIAGGRPLGVGEAVLANVKHMLADEPLDLLAKR